MPSPSPHRPERARLTHSVPHLTGSLKVLCHERVIVTDGRVNRLRSLFIRSQFRHRPSVMGRLPSSTICQWPIVATRSFVREARRLWQLVSPERGSELPGPLRLFRVGRLQRLPGLEKEPRSRMCPSPGSRFRPWSARRLPTSCLVQNDSRVPICTACSNAIRRFGKQGRLRASSGTASRRGDTGGSPTFKRGSFLLADCRWDAAAPMLSEAPSHLRV